LEKETLKLSKPPIWNKENWSKHKLSCRNENKDKFSNIGAHRCALSLFLWTSIW